MTLLGHLVRADVRRFRLLLAAWIAIVVLDAAVTGVQPLVAADQRLSWTIALLATVLFLARWLGMAMIAALVVQADPLVGSNAFWMTRPIPPRTLLASKLLLLWTALIAVQVIAQATLMALCHLALPVIGLAALQATVWLTLWLVLAMVPAAMTRTPARFAAAVAAVVLALALLINVLIALSMRGTDGPTMVTVTARGLTNPWLGVVLVLLLTAAGVSTLAVQYRRRSVRAAAGTLAAAIAVTWAIMIVWPWAARPLPAPEWASRDSAIRLTGSAEKTRFDPAGAWSFGDSSQAWRTSRAGIGVAAMEPGWVATLRLIDSTLQFDDGVVLRTVANGFSSFVLLESEVDPWNQAMREVLGVDRVLVDQPRIPETETVPAITISDADFQARLGRSGIYRGRFMADLDRLEVAAALPLRAGAEYRGPRQRIVIDAVIPQTHAVSVRLRQYRAATMFDSRQLPELSFYLRDREGSQAIAGGNRGGGLNAINGVGLPFGFTVGTGSVSGFMSGSEYVRFPAQPADWRPESLARAEMVIVRRNLGGSVTRSVEIPNYPVREAPAGR